MSSPGAAKPSMFSNATGVSSGTESLTAPGVPNDSNLASPAHLLRGQPLIPPGALAEIRIMEGPAMIKSENSRLLNYVTLNERGLDIVGFVSEAQPVVGNKVKLPEGVHIEWSGEFEYQVRAASTLRFVSPLCSC